MGENFAGIWESDACPPTLKKMIALASVKREHSAVGTMLGMEMTVEAVRHTVSAKVVAMPFFNPKRKTAVPV